MKIVKINPITFEFDAGERLTINQAESDMFLHDLDTNMFHRQIDALLKKELQKCEKLKGGKS